MFCESDFNQDISNWDVLNVKDMSSMFFDSKFNQDISGWNVSRVTNMFAMFNKSNFNQDISEWNVSNVTDMSSMFCESDFNQDISNWDVSNVKNMSGMFMNNSGFNQDISQWNVSSVTNMGSMFKDSEFNQYISRWNVSKVKSMNGMFHSSKFNQDISGWNISRVTDMFAMFNKSNFNQDISSWNVSNVTEMRYMFNDSVFNQDISSWNISIETNIDQMFSHINNPNVPNWYNNSNRRQRLGYNKMTDPKLETFNFIRFTNNEEPGGSAFWIHTRFSNINLASIRRLINEIPGINESIFNIAANTYEGKLRLNNLIRDNVELLYNEENETDCIKKILVLGRFLKYVYEDYVINNVIKPVFMYMWSSNEWNDQDRRNYITVWINESAAAYDDLDIEGNVSHIHGIIERMVFSISNATIMKEGEVSERQRSILQHITPESAKPLNELFHMWKVIICNDNELKKETSDKLITHFRKYIASKVKEIPGHKGFTDKDLDYWDNKIVPTKLIVY